MTARACAVALVAAALAGCATPGADLARPVALDADCHGSLAEVPAVSIAPVDPERDARPAHYADVARCVESESGRRPVALFAIDPALGAQAIRVTLVEGRAGVLAARARVLDGAREPIASHAFADFQRRGATWTLTVFPPLDRGARYLAIEPDDGSVGGTTRRTRAQAYVAPIITPTVIGSYADGVEQRVEVPLIDAGMLVVTTEPDAPRLIETR